MRPLICAVLFTASAVWAQQGTAKEAALGGQLAQEVRQTTSPIESAAVRDYVEGIAGRLAAQLASAGFQYTFSVIADDLGGQTHAPSSLPGGYVFVPAGLILTAQDDAEFAGMLAHAMAHIAERHGTRQAARDRTANNMNLPVVFIGGGAGVCAAGNGSAIPQSFLSLQRGFETEADLLAIKTMSAAGYDPEALVRYIARSQTERESPGLLARDSRIAGMRKAIQELTPRTYTTTTELSSIQQEVKRLLPSKPRGAPSLKHPE